MSLHDLYKSIKDIEDSEDSEDSEGLELVFVVSYDLKDASSEYSLINRELELSGYSRNSNLGESTIPRNLFAGKKKVPYDETVEDQKTFLEGVSKKFEEQVIGILEKHAPGKFDKVYTSVSVEATTAIRLK